MEAIILAAGKGIGLHPITHTIHKVLVPVLDKSLIHRHLIELKKANIDKVIVVVGYLKDQVINEVSKVVDLLDIEVVFVDQKEPLGTGHALSVAVPYIASEEFLVIYGDIYYEEGALVELTNVKGNALMVAKVSDPRRYGAVIIKNGLVREIIEKPRTIISNTVNAGIYKFQSDVMKYLDKMEISPRGEYELTDVIYQLINNGKEIKALTLSSWSDVGRPWKLIEINKEELRKISNWGIYGRVESGVVIRGNVYVGEGSEIRSGTYIIGPVWIGNNVIIGPNSYIRPNTVILDGARIGFNVEVKESIIMRGTHASHQSYIGDSVIGEYSNLGAGTVLANLRFDEKEVKVKIKGKLEGSGRKKLGAFIGGYVKTGVNVSTFPGVKIGAYSWIYPGVVVTDDVPPYSILKYNGEIVPLRRT